MSDTPVKSLPPIADLLSHSFETCKKNLYEFFVLSVIALAIYAVIGIISVGVVFATGIGGAIMARGIQDVFKVPGVIMILGWLLFAVVVCIIVFGFAVQTAYILVAAGEKKGSYVDLLKKGVFLFPSFLRVSLLSLFLIWGSIFVFILPAILIGFMLTFTIYEIVLSGNRGIYAIQRSSYIVSQNFFPVVGRILFLTIVGFLIGAVISGIQEFVSDNSFFAVVMVIISVVFNVLWGWFSVVYSVNLYRQAKAVVDPHKTSGLLWMWILAGIGWVIGVGVLFMALSFAS